jgi:hypothetical protein
LQYEVAGVRGGRPFSGKDVNFSQQTMRRCKSEGGRPSSGKDISFSHQPIFRVVREERYRRPLKDKSSKFGKFLMRRLVREAGSITS